MGDLFMSGEQKSAMKESRTASREARQRQKEEDLRLKEQEEKRAERLQRQRVGRRSLMSGYTPPATPEPTPETTPEPKTQVIKKRNGRKRISDIASETLLG